MSINIYKPPGPPPSYKNKYESKVNSERYLLKVMNLNSYRTFARNIALDAFDEADRKEWRDESKTDGFEEKMLSDHLGRTRELNFLWPRGKFADTIFRGQEKSSRKKLGFCFTFVRGTLLVLHKFKCRYTESI